VSHTSAPPLAALSYVSLAVAWRHSNIRSPSAVDVINVLGSFNIYVQWGKKNSTAALNRTADGTASDVQEGRWS